MINVVLHGEIGREVGKKNWLLDVKTVAEALRAIEANTNKLYRYLRLKNNGEALYRVIFGKRDLESLYQLASPLSPSCETIHIVPVLAGAGNTGGILAIVGIVLLVVAVSIISFGAAGPTTVAAFMTSGTFGAWAAGVTLTLGISMTISGISSMLTRTPKADKNDKPENKPSYLFSGSVNTLQQGLPVPVGFGEAIVGSATISAGLSASDIPV